MDFIHHMRRSAFFRRQAGRPDNGNYLEREYAGRLIGRMAKNFRGSMVDILLIKISSIHSKGFMIIREDVAEVPCLTEFQEFLG